MRLSRPLIHIVALVAASVFAGGGCGLSMDMLATGSVEPDTATDIDTDTTDSDRDTPMPPVSGEGIDTQTRLDTDTDTLGDLDAGVADSSGCLHGEIPPSEVLLIGDSWISLPGPGVGKLARADGIIAFDEDYVSRAVGGATIDKVVLQYENYLLFSGQVIKAVIMNGGAVDTFAAAGSDSSVEAVVNAFTGFLAKLASEGVVEHVIYVLYSEGSAIPGIDKLRSPMGTACDKSNVPCHFLDLQSVMAGHPEYIIDTINPSPLGSDAIAAAIWETMQENCIAQ